MNTCSVPATKLVFGASNFKYIRETMQNKA